MIPFQSNRVVITGLGIVAPNGIGKDAFWKTLVLGESGIGPITRFDASRLRSRIAGEVKNFDPNQIPSAVRLKVRRKARHTQFAMAATAMALEDASIEMDPASPMASPGAPLLPLFLGLGCSSLEMISDDVTAIHEGGPRHASPYIISEAIPNSVTGAIAQMLGVPTQSFTYSTACAAGLDAVGAAYQWIREGKSDIAIAGGTESQLAMLPMANFDNAGMSSRRNEEPQKASRPFDLTRDSGVLSEGCGVVILENLESAMARGVEPYLEIRGYGNQTDPDPQKPGSGFEHSMRQALSNASWLPTDVDYISAWGPGHPVIDRIETEMIKKVFGKHAYRLSVSSIKGVIGNPISAAGPLMLAGCSLMFRHGLIPPTANYEVPDPECDLDYVPKVARPARVNRALLNAHGVGGANSAMVVQRVP
jgi:3-oxoacyl-[acyl-carrier-protein] synthase II